MPRAPQPPTHSPGRLAFLDWTRGLAALIMLQGHVFHSLTAKELRQDAPYILSQFVGGITPAIFLFLTGVTLAFLLESRARQGIPPLGRVRAALRRAGYLLTLAFLFRLQLWAFGWPHSPWTDLFKVDILNCMALAVGVMSLTGVFTAAERVPVALLAGIGIAAASPIISNLDWSSVHPFLAAYLVPDYQTFSFFPWAAFVAFGVSAGSLLRLPQPVDLARLMQWAAIMGFGLILGGRYFAEIPYSLYQKSEFWLNSPSLVFIKVGVILLIAAFAYLWCQQESVQRWSWVRQLGTTSLIVYWVHIELVYGRWMGSWKESLTVPQTVAVAIVVILAMLALSIAQTKWKASFRNWVDGFRGWAASGRLAERRVSGD
ncbi:MAG: DUF1624 domain-containing protein [Bryobacteraceae bacterium]|nr:DUF1624 domain-containing protein [Bryobacteraceae bacterium]